MAVGFERWHHHFYWKNGSRWHICPRCTDHHPIQRNHFECPKCNALSYAFNNFLDKLNLFVEAL